jgi:hypothetical protein
MSKSHAQVLPDAAEERIVLAYYYIWFTKGWFDGTDSPSLLAAMEDVHPAIGPYDSHDEDVIDAHMKQCQLAGLDALAVSWFYNKRNIGKDGPYSGASNDDILESIMKIGSEHGLRICIDMEAANLKAETLHAALTQYLSTYTGDPRVLHARGKPVILCWSTANLGIDTWTEITDDLRGDGLDGFYIPSQQDDPAYLRFLEALEFYTPLSTTDSVMQQYTTARAEVDKWNREHPGDTPKRFHGTVMPGFDDRMIPGRTDRDDYAHYRYRRGTENFWESFAAAMACRPEWLHVNSFNELAEHSHIEATVEDGDKYLRLTARFAEIFKQAVWKI